MECFNYTQHANDSLHGNGGILAKIKFLAHFYRKDNSEWSKSMLINMGMKPQMPMIAFVLTLPI